MSEGKKRQRGVQSVDIALRILQVVRVSRQPMMLRDIAECIGITSAQAHTYMTSLKRLGLVEQSDLSTRYGLSDATLELAGRVIDGDPILVQTMQTARSFCRDHGQMVVVDRMVGGVPISLLVLQGRRILSLNLRSGAPGTLANSAAARLFDAWADRPVQSDEAVAKIRQNGWVLASGTPVPHLASLAAPVKKDGRIVATMSVVGSPADVPPDPGRGLLKALLDHVAALSEQAS